MATNKVQRVPVDSRNWFVDKGCSEEHSDDTSAREPWKYSEAKAMLTKLFAPGSRRCGYDDIMLLSGYRFLCQKERLGYCSCPAFMGPRICFHVHSMQLEQHIVTMPDLLDATPIGVPSRGRPKRAGDRGQPAPKN